VYIAGSLTVAGSNVLQNVTVQNTLLESSNISISNAGTGPALSVIQTENTANPVAQFIAGATPALYINSSAYVGIGKSNPAYALDVSGSINFTGSLNSNGLPFSVGSGTSTISTGPTYVELISNSNITPAMSATVHTWTSPSFTSPSVASSALVSYNGSGWVSGGGLFVVTAALNGVSRTTEVYNPGTTHMPVPALQFVVQLAPSTSYSITLTFSNNALTDANDFHSLNVTMFPNAATGSLGITSCYAMWSTASNVASGNYVGLTSQSPTIVQNSAGNGINPFSPSTGLFTCQYAGVYQLSMTTNGQVPTDIVQVYKNGSLLAAGLQSVGNVNNSTALTASVYCTNGDTLGFYVSSGTIQGTSSSGTQNCSIALVGSAGNITSQFYLGNNSNVYLAAGSNLGIGLSNPSGPLQIMGQGAYSASNAIVVASNANVGIGKANPQFALDVAGTIAFSSMSSISFAGIVAYFAGSSAPTGWLVANGTLVSRTSYSNLFANIGTTYGAGDGSNTFALPDLRGYFIRSLDLSANIDTGRTLGTVQQDAYLNHSHGASSTVTDPGHVHGYIGSQTPNSYPNATGLGGMNPTNNPTGNTNSAVTGITVTTTVSTSTTGGSETRPKNIALLACIKY
jgi:microcystin-dependent protein